MPDLLLDELTQEIQYQASFIHSYLCKGITQTPECSCSIPEAEVKSTGPPGERNQLSRSVNRQGDTMMHI